MYAIIRVAKVKSLGSLSGLSRHHTRASPTPNANTKAKETIRVLVGSGNPYNDAKALLPAKPRKNAVLAMEHFFSLSFENKRSLFASDAMVVTDSTAKLYPVFQSKSHVYKY